MDNYNSNGSNVGDDTFGFIPPNLMFPENARESNRFSSKEEMERYYYHMDHDKDLPTRHSSH